MPRDADRQRPCAAASRQDQGWAVPWHRPMWTPPRIGGSRTGLGGGIGGPSDPPGVVIELEREAPIGEQLVAGADAGRGIRGEQSELDRPVAGDPLVSRQSEAHLRLVASQGTQVDLQDLCRRLLRGRPGADGRAVRLHRSTISLGPTATT